MTTTTWAVTVGIHNLKFQTSLGGERTARSSANLRHRRSQRAPARPRPAWCLALQRQVLHRRRPAVLLDQLRSVRRQRDRLQRFGRLAVRPSTGASARAGTTSSPRWTWTATASTAICAGSTAARASSSPLRSEVPDRGQPAWPSVRMIAADDMPLAHSPCSALAVITPVLACSAHAARRARLNLNAINGLKLRLEEAVRSGLTLQQYRDRAVSEAQLRRLMSMRRRRRSSRRSRPGAITTARSQSRIEPNCGGQFRRGFDVDSGRTDPGHRERRSPSTVTPPRCPAVASALEAFVPKVGERFDHAQYEASKTAIETALGDARLSRRETDRTSRRSHSAKRTRAHRARLERWAALHASARRPLPADSSRRSFLRSLHALDAKAMTIRAPSCSTCSGGWWARDYFSTVTVQPHPEKAVDLRRAGGSRHSRLPSATSTARRCMPAPIVARAWTSACNGAG